MKWLTALIAAFVLLFSLQAEAGRLAGGKSMGRQSSNVTQRDSAPNAPAQGVGNAAAKPGAAAPSRPWGAMLGGLAAGDEVLSRVGGNRKSCDHSGIRDNCTYCTSIFFLTFM